MYTQTKYYLSYPDIQPSCIFFLQESCCAFFSSVGFFEDLAASFHLPKGIPSIWTQLENAFHSDMTIFLLRDILTFITDLLFLICGDEAPLPARNARHIRNKIEEVVLPLVKERRPDLANQETWDLVEENAKCLRDALNTVSDREKHTRTAL